MIYYLTNANYVDGYRFWVRFNTGEEGEVNLQEVLTVASGRFAETFKNCPESVRDFYLDPWPTLAWHCGFDIAPEHLYQRFVQQNRQHLVQKSVSRDAERKC